MHQLKTGALIRASLRLGALAVEASNEEVEALDGCGEAIGLAFQVKDDLLDIEASTDQLGKPQGADSALNKPTYPGLMGLEEARAYARELQQQALTALQNFGAGADPLRALAEYIVSREH